MTNESLPKQGKDLYENPLTKEDVEVIVERSLGPNYEIHNFYMKRYSDENLGFLSAQRNLIVEASQEGSSRKEQHTYFTKSVPHHIDGQAQFLLDSKLFVKETGFYDRILPELMRDSKDKSWVAQCYLAKDDILVFENLKVKNYTMKDKYFDVPTLKLALSSLAKMHAASMLAEKRLGKSFLEMYPQLLDEVLYSMEGPFREYNIHGLNALVNVAKYLGLDHNVVDKAYRLVFEKIRPSKTRRNVVCHGDAWSNNIMFNGDKCALMDFQLLRYAPPMHDVAHLIYHNAKKELRDEYEIDLLKHYHEALCEALKDGEVDAPSFENILEEYDESRIIGLIVINSYFQLNHIPGDKLLEFMESSEGFNNLLFRDRVDLVLGIMKKDERYKEIMSSAIKELVDMAPKYLS